MAERGELVRGLRRRRSGKRGAIGGVALGTIPGVPSRPLTGRADPLEEDVRARGVAVFDRQAGLAELGRYGV